MLTEKEIRDMEELLRNAVINELRKSECSTERVALKLHISIQVARKILRQLRERGIIGWYAQWYGCNAGYYRVYYLKEDRK